jgi:uncharacterized protein
MSNAPETAQREDAPRAAEDNAQSTPSDDLMRQLAQFEGQSIGPPTSAPDPVNQPMIRHWVEAMGDANPVYVDEDLARASGFPGVVAPPTMLQAWVMRGYRATVETEAARQANVALAGVAEPNSEVGEASSNDGSPGPSAQDRLFALLDSAGFTSVVATNCEQKYTRPLVLGDRLTTTSVIESVSPKKATGLGDGHFVTTRTDFTDQHGELVATMRFRILRFRPRREPVRTQSDVSKRPRPALTHDNSFFFEGAKEGKLLIQRCAACATLRHPPRPMCPKCRSLEWDVVESSGRGKLFSFVVVHHPQVPGFDYPLPIGLVELEEGTRLVAEIVGASSDELAVDMDVECEFLVVDDELALPRFAPSPTASASKAR